MLLFKPLIIQFGGKVFSTVPMDIQHYIITLLIAVLIIPADFIRKALTKKQIRYEVLQIFKVIKGLGFTPNLF